MSPSQGQFEGHVTHQEAIQLLRENQNDDQIKSVKADRSSPPRCERMFSCMKCNAKIWRESQEFNNALVVCIILNVGVL